MCCICAYYYVAEQLFPEIIKVIPPTISLTATTTDTADGCAFVPVSRNTRDFRVLACRGNNSRLADGSTGNLNLTGGLQISQLQDFYAWNNQRTPENPFVLYNFNTPVIITRIVITFALLQNYTISSKIPIITMFVSDTNSNYPSRSIPVNYNDNNVPNTGVYHLELVPSVGEPYRYWCVDMEPPNGTNWVIVSEVTLYQQLTQTGKQSSHALYNKHDHTSSKDSLTALDHKIVACILCLFRKLRQF